MDWSEPYLKLEQSHKALKDALNQERYEDAEELILSIMKHNDKLYDMVISNLKNQPLKEEAQMQNLSLSRRILPALSTILMAFVSGLNAALGFDAALHGRDFAMHVVISIGFGFISALCQLMLVRQRQ